MTCKRCCWFAHACVSMYVQTGAVVCHQLLATHPLCSTWINISLVIGHVHGVLECVALFKQIPRLVEYRYVVHTSRLRTIWNNMYSPSSTPPCRTLCWAMMQFVEGGLCTGLQKFEDSQRRNAQHDQVVCSTSTLSDILSGITTREGKSCYSK